MTIYFGGSPDAVRKQYDIYAKIESNKVGQVIIDLIRKIKKDLIFLPRDAGKVAISGVCNAETVAQEKMDSAPKGASGRAPPYWYRGVEDNPETSEDERFTLVPYQWTGTGAGSNVKIFFDPDGFMQSNCVNLTGAGSQIDEVLFHEMVHALRYMQGKSKCIPTDNVRYDHEEEFLAIVVTNVYISAAGGSLLRADHQNFATLKPPLTTSSGFLSDPENLKLMNINRLTWTETFMALSGVVSAPFNPFLELSHRLAWLGPVSN